MDLQLISNDSILNWLTENSVYNYKLKKGEVFNKPHNAVLCSVCGKPKKILRWSDRLGDVAFFPVEKKCDCEKKAIEKEEKARHLAFVKSYYNTEPYLQEIKIDYREARFKDIEGGHMDSCFYNTLECLRAYVDSYSAGSKGVSITGDIGTGKSTLMAGLRNELLDRGFSCALATVTKICEHTRKHTETEEFCYRTYWDVDVLIIDDIGADISSADKFKRSEYNSILFSLVNERLTNNRTVCYTSNLSKSDMEATGIDKRITDRLREMIGNVYALEGESKRG